MELKFQVQVKVQKPLAEVFDGVVNVEKLCRYFIAKSSAPLVAGTTVKWSFPEFPDEFPVVVRELVPNERLVIEWESAEGGYNTTVVFNFKVVDATNTLVQVSESGWKLSEKNLEASYGNCGGWMHMLLCLKAYLEHGINLRAGSV